MAEAAWPNTSAWSAAVNWLKRLPLPLGVDGMTGGSRSSAARIAVFSCAGSEGRWAKIEGRIAQGYQRHSDVDPGRIGQAT